MDKNKQARKYISISVLRDAMIQIDIFMKVNPFGSLYSSRSDFVHRAIEALLNKHILGTLERDMVEVRTWYLEHSDMLSKRGINNFDELLNRAVKYSHSIKWPTSFIISAANYFMDQHWNDLSKQRRDDCENDHQLRWAHAVEAIQLSRLRDRR